MAAPISPEVIYEHFSALSSSYPELETQYKHLVRGDLEAIEEVLESTGFLSDERKTLVEGYNVAAAKILTYADDLFKKISAENMIDIQQVLLNTERSLCYVSERLYFSLKKVKRKYQNDYTISLPNFLSKSSKNIEEMSEKERRIHQYKKLAALEKKLDALSEKFLKRIPKPDHLFSRWIGGDQIVYNLKSITSLRLDYENTLHRVWRLPRQIDGQEFNEGYKRFQAVTHWHHRNGWTGKSRIDSIYDPENGLLEFEITIGGWIQAVSKGKGNLEFYYKKNTKSYHDEKNNGHGYFKELIQLRPKEGVELLPYQDYSLNRFNIGANNTQRNIFNKSLLVSEELGSVDDFGFYGFCLSEDGTPFTGGITLTLHPRGHSLQNVALVMTEEEMVQLVPEKPGLTAGTNLDTHLKELNQLLREKGDDFAWVKTIKDKYLSLKLSGSQETLNTSTLSLSVEEKAENFLTFFARDFDKELFGSLLDEYGNEAYCHIQVPSGLGETLEDTLFDENTQITMSGTNRDKPAPLSVQKPSRLEKFRRTELSKEYNKQFKTRNLKWDYIIDIKRKSLFKFAISKEGKPFFEITEILFGNKFEGAYDLLAQLTEIIDAREEALLGDPTLVPGSLEFIKKCFPANTIDRDF